MRTVLYLFGFLTDDDVTWLVEHSRKRMMVPDEILIRQGEPSADLFIVIHGRFEIEIAGRGVIASRGQGDILGEMSFVDDAPPSSTVRCREPAVVLAVDRSMMAHELDSNTGFAARFYRALAVLLSDRLRGLQGGGIGSDVQELDELDPVVLDRVAMAGLRFRDLLRLVGETGPGSAER